MNYGRALLPKRSTGTTSRSLAVQVGQHGREHRPHELPDACSQRVVAAGQRVVELADDPIGAERFGADDASGIEHERGAQPRGELCDSAERIGVLARTVELGVEDRVWMLGLMGPVSPTGRWRSGSVQPAPYAINSP
jgi:hypothetical protein